MTPSPEGRRQVSRLFHGNLRDAKKERIRLLGEVDQGSHDGTNARVDQLFGEWIKELERKGPIAAATLICEVGDPFSFARESKFARWTGTGAVALSYGEGTGDPVKHRLDFRGNRRLNSVLHIASVTQARDQPEAQQYLPRKRAEGKTRREARRAHKRHLAKRVIRRMWRDEQARTQQFTAAA